jgi:hypothetical protein
VLLGHGFPSDWVEEEMADDAEFRLSIFNGLPGRHFGRLTEKRQKKFKIFRLERIFSSDL